ncbi:MAG: FecR domain-containing protein [Alphaproteobacteria bacterium]|nr:FecR domain-containing protein [Alphaproteobacteria bacterium]
MRAKYGSLVVAASLIVYSAVVAAAGNNIGVTAALTNKVTGTLEGDLRKLGIGSSIFQNETIDTWKESTTQLLFLDETTLTMGPDSSMVLDKFVFDPDSNAGEFVLSTTKGAFRFITGSVDPSSYTIETPIATMGVRGTIIEWRVNENNVLLKLVHGAADICNTGGECISLDQPGTYVITDGSTFTGGVDGDTSGTIVLEEADDSLYALFLGSKRFVPLQNTPQATITPPGPPPPPGGGPPPPPPPPPPIDGFAPNLTGAGTVPAGLSGGLSPGLLKNRDPVTFEPKGKVNGTGDKS